MIFIVASVTDVGAPQAALYCRKHLLRNTAACYGVDGIRGALEKGFEMTDRHFVADAERNEWVDGSTALVVAISKDEIVVANAGDARAVMVTRKGDDGVHIEALSTDHSPSSPSEQARIESMGGLVVYKGGVGRVMGVLCVSRSIGDVQLRPYVSAEPEIKVVERGDEQLFVVMATDGLWDSLSSQDVGALLLAW